MKNKGRKAATVVGVIAMIPVYFGGRASANNFSGATGHNGCGVNMQDNNTMSYHRSPDVSVNLYNAIAYALNNAVIPTDVLLAAEQTTPNAQTDVVYHEANYVGDFCGLTWHSAGSMIGYTYCTSLAGAACDRHEIYTDQSWEVNASQDQRKRHACHETGHSLGLTHPSAANGAPAGTTCMGPNLVFTYSADHEVKHINDNY